MEVNKNASKNNLFVQDKELSLVHAKEFLFCFVPCLWRKIEAAGNTCFVFYLFVLITKQ